MAKERRYINKSYEKEYLSSSASSLIGDLISTPGDRHWCFLLSSGGLTHFGSSFDADNPCKPQLPDISGNISESGGDKCTAGIDRSYTVEENKNIPVPQVRSYSHAKNLVKMSSKSKQPLWLG
jgi:hypothetical protein